MSIPNSKIFSIIFWRVQFINGSDCKSRSRRRTDCDHRGLGRSLSKQKPTRSLKGRQVGFAHLYYRCIACYFYTKFGIIVASNAYGAPYAKNAHFRFGGSAHFLFVEAPPQSPANKKLFWATLPSGHRLRNWELLSLDQTVICKPGIISVMFTIVIILWRILRR